MPATKGSRKRTCERCGEKRMCIQQATLEGRLVRWVCLDCEPKRADVIATVSRNVERINYEVMKAFRGTLAPEPRRSRKRRRR